MHHALRVNHHFNAFRRHIEQPARFNILQPLVHQGGGIDGDLRPHVPVGVAHRLLRRHRGELLPGPAPERAAGGGQQQAPHARADAFRRQALENGVVLRIHRQQRGAVALDRIHEQGAGDHQGLFIGE